MNHPILGEITRDNDDGVARVQYDDRMIDVRIIADEIPYEETVDVAAAVVQDLKRLDDCAKKVAAADLTDNYNDGWNEYDEVQDDGTVKTVTHPELTPEEFAQKLTLSGLNVTGDMLSFFYDDEGMFWGHSVVVTSKDGIAFADPYAEIFG